MSDHRRSRRSPPRDRDRRRHRHSPSPQGWYSDSSDDRTRRPRRHRYDSPPKESVMVASMHGLTDQPVASVRTIRELSAAAAAAAASSRSEQQRASRELYIGNIPQGMPILTLIDRINTILVDMGATVMPGKPILSGWLGGEGQFAFVEFRTPQECSNAMSLNGYLFEGTALRVGRPRNTVSAGIAGDNGSGMLEDGPVFGGSTQFSLDDLPGLGIPIQPPLDESGKIEKLALVGAPLNANPDELEKILREFGDLNECIIVDNEQLKTRTVLFEYTDVDYQRKCVYKADKFRYDRDHHLAVVRQDEAIMRGYVSLPNEQISGGLGRTMRATPTRIVWLVNFPMNVNEKELEVELNLECAKFGQLENVHVMNVERDRIQLQDGMGLALTGLSDSELVAIVAFKNMHDAIKCKKYISGAKCFYFSEDKFSDSDFSTFESNMESLNIVPEAEVVTPMLTPTVKNGKVISVEKELIARSIHLRKKTKLAPEDQEIID